MLKREELEIKKKNVVPSRDADTSISEQRGGEVKACAIRSEKGKIEERKKS